ncbi:hypothetical protein M1E17_18260 [Arthrobacter sp. D1-29]
MTHVENLRRTTRGMGRSLRSRAFLLTWVLPLAAILGILVLYVASEQRIYFYDPRGYQEVAINTSDALRKGPHALYLYLKAQSLSEYPPYWALPLAVLPPELLNLRVPYEAAMGLFGLLPMTVLTTKIACRTLGLRVSPWIVLAAGLNPLTFLVCVQGVPDLIGMSLILAAVWILMSRPLHRWTLFWALLIGAGSLLVKKNFLFDLAAVVACYLLAYTVAALRYRRPPERWRSLLKETLSLPVLLAGAAVIGGATVLTPGTLTSIFSRDNSLFYISYQTSLTDALTANLSYAGGFVALIIAIAAVVALAVVIARRTSTSVTRNAVFVASFLVVSEVVWAIIQKQSGIIHQVHVWPLLMTVGFVGLVRLLPRPRPLARQIVAAGLATALFAFMFAQTPALAGIRFAASQLPGGLYPNVTEPFVQSNLPNMVEVASTVRTLSQTNGPVMVPIASTSFNSSLLYQTYVQQAGAPIPDIYQLPQVDLRDAQPWSGLIGDDGRTVLVSQQWLPDLPEGHHNLQAVNEFLDSPAAQPWIKSSQPLDAGVPGQLADLRAVHLLIPESDALAFAAAIRPYLPVNADHGLQGAVALLTDQGLRTEGPSAKTPTAWTITAGSPAAPTRLLVDATAAQSIKLSMPNAGCSGVQYQWTSLETPTGSAPAAASDAGQGTLPAGAAQTVPVPETGTAAWSQVLTLSTDSADPNACQVVVGV